MAINTASGSVAASRTGEPPEAVARLQVGWAQSESEVRQAQRLRYRVFVEEMGARIRPLPGTGPGMDADLFDAYCDHLLVTSMDADEGPGQLVGTYRLLRPDAARRAGGLYLGTEFDLAPLESLLAGAVELGRSCVHPDWRSGPVIMALWTALCRYMRAHRLETMIGCASVGMVDGGEGAARLWRGLRHTHLVAPALQVRPHVALPIHDGDNEVPAGVLRDPAMPPLIRGYLRCGAQLLGPPSLDQAFKTADLPMILRVDQMAPRYRRHYFER